jgi:diguanylate cyclase (GGDEF)-like protein
MTVGSESGGSSGASPETPDSRDLRASLGAAREQLAVALREKDAAEAALRTSEEQFRTRGAELARYQAELEAANDRLRGLVVTDDLTGLRNRRAFEERLAFEFSMARRKRRDLTVVLVDADDFKRVNDRLGHPAGDSVLQQLARVLQATVRLTDLAVRFGGEEFAVILPENDERSSLLWCARFKKALEDAEWEHYPVTVSMGAAGLTAACVDGSHLVAMADQALYRAKRMGKNRFVGASERSGEAVG